MISEILKPKTATSFLGKVLICTFAIPLVPVLVPFVIFFYCLYGLLASPIALIQKLIKKL